jgi:protein O-GlcNAc transferase
MGGLIPHCRLRHGMQMTEAYRKTPGADFADATALRQAVAFHRAGQLTEAERLYREVLHEQPGNFDAAHLLGVIAHQRGEYEDAIRLIDAALLINQSAAIAHNSRGAALKELGRNEEALASYASAISLKPDYAEAFNNRGVALQALKRFEEALASCRQAVALKPDFAEAYYNRGNVFSALKQYEAALADYDQAIALKPDYAEAFSCRGAMLKELKRLPEALASYDRALALNPGLKYLPGDRLDAKLNLCDWAGLTELCSQVEAAIDTGISCASPFQLLATPIGPAEQFRCAKRLIADEFPRAPVALWRGERYEHDRIRIAYVSADFRNHPVSVLAAGLFEEHDREQLEVFGIGFGPDDSGPVRSRLKRSFDRFFDADRLSDQAVASLLRELEIDIAVDLMGLTGNSRLGVFAMRPSPIQVTYLGYAGTTGAPYIDYIIADPFVIPITQEEHFSEKVARLPESFQVNDCKRMIAPSTPSRAEAGLPNDAFVYCCFNSNGKITPDVFDVWMRLLTQVEGSVLWLAAADASARANLGREAARRGVSPDRLIFAGKLPHSEDHLARHRLADLFLDTLHFNAHSTASDALWAGLPVLTCPGATFASRVAGSLLNAVGLPELIARSLADYESLALRLAREPDLLASIKQRLARNRETSSLFDTARLTRHIEAAYRAMWERYQHGLPPRSFDVAPCPTAELRHANRSNDGATRSARSSEMLRAPADKTFQLRLSNGTALALRPTLEEMTTYVALEQETWFEKELAFLTHMLTPGMSAIDIGANVGIYSLAMARQVAPGSVYAYEPGGVPRGLLERSREINQASNLKILPFALSDSHREGHLAFGASSELNVLAEGGPGERVMVTTLDNEEERLRWSSPDFVKIDAEGEEQRILVGGRRFFARHSPLVMFEINAGTGIDGSLQLLFPTLGYGLFRLLTGLPVLVPVDAREQLDGDELNIFAAKPDRAAQLARAGMLVERKCDWRPAQRREQAHEQQHHPLTLLTAQGFASAFPWDAGSVDPDYHRVLSAYEVWRDKDVPLQERCGALDYAFRELCALCERASTFPRLSTLARIAWEAGRRAVCARATRDFIAALESRPITISEPFWPACPRFDAIAPADQAAVWFIASVLEQHERVRAFSSYFQDDTSGIDWLCAQRFTSSELERRRVLIATRARGKVQGKIDVPERLRVEAPDHLNAEVWRSGLEALC